MSTSRASPLVNVADAASLFAALGDETRLHIVTRLSDGGALSIMRLTDLYEPVVTPKAIYYRRK